METLGRAIYERRQKAASKSNCSKLEADSSTSSHIATLLLLDPIILKALPKGYVVEYSTNYKFSGHPSKLMFHSTSKRVYDVSTIHMYSFIVIIGTFLEHLLWLEAMSHPKSIESRRICKCVVCTKVRNKGRSKRDTRNTRRYLSKVNSRLIFFILRHSINSRSSIIFRTCFASAYVCTITCWFIIFQGINTNTRRFRDNPRISP